MHSRVTSFNTASGMDCMQCKVTATMMPSTRQFQYRKRYGLHAIVPLPWRAQIVRGFNTASGMDCMQYHHDRDVNAAHNVSIPQAVWIACNEKTPNEGSRLASFNTASGMDCMQ